MNLAALVPLFVALGLYLLTLALGQWMRHRRASASVQVRYATLFVTATALALALLHLHTDMEATAGHDDVLCLPLWLLVTMGCSAVGFILGFFCQQWRSIRLLDRWATTAPASLQSVLPALATSLGVKRLPQVRLVEFPQPLALTIGTCRPIIYLSSWMTRELSPVELEGVLAHELAHIARQDNLIALVSTTLLGATAFVPSSWSALKALLAERELATDALAVSVTGKPITLARGLLKASDTPAAHFGSTAGLLEVSMVEKRVHHLIALHRAGPRSGRGNANDKARLVLLSLISALPIFWLIFELPHLLQLP